MGIKVVQPLGVGGINLNTGYNSPYRVGFGADTFQSTSVNRYMTEDAIRLAINSNPKIKDILKEINTPLKIDMQELEKLSATHLKQTQDIAAGIIKNLPKGLKERVNIKSVKDAAMLHDIGKVLIPKEILNKNGALDDVERNIMHRHSELGFELLKNTDIDTRTLDLVKYHHQNSSHTGYPKVKNDFLADINLQILSAADKFSALTEKRAYKPAYDTKKALAIIYKDVQDGNLHPFVFKALRDYALTPVGLSI